MSKTRTTMSLTTGTFPIMNGIHYISNDEDITDHSDITEIGSFAKVINDLGTEDDATVEVPPGDYDLQGNTVVVPDNIHLKCNKGTLFSNGTLTINGTFEAGIYQVFDSDIIIDNLNCTLIIVNWWGLDENASQKAVDSWLSSGGVIKWVGVHNWSNCVSLMFESSSSNLYMDFYAATINVTIADNYALDIQASTYITKLSIKGLNMRLLGTNDSGLYIDGGKSGSSSLSAWNLQDIYIVGFDNDGVIIANNTFEGSLTNVACRASSINTTGSCIKFVEDEDSTGVVSSIYMYNCATRGGCYGLYGISPVSDIHIYGGTFLTAQKNGIRLENAFGVNIIGTHIENNYEGATDLNSGGAGIHIIGDCVLTGVKATTNSKQKYAVQLYISENRTAIVKNLSTLGDTMIDTHISCGNNATLEISGKSSVYVSPGFNPNITRIGCNYLSGSTTTGNTDGILETELVSFTIPAYIAVSGTKYRIFIRGDISGSIGTKAIKLYIGTTTIPVASSITIGGRYYFYIDVYQVQANLFYDYVLYIGNTLVKRYGSVFVHDPYVDVDVIMSGQCTDADSNISRLVSNLKFE